MNTIKLINENTNRLRKKRGNIEERKERIRGDPLTCVIRAKGKTIYVRPYEGSPGSLHDLISLV